MNKGLCSDWLMIESQGQKGSRVVTCGDLQKKQKVFETGSDQLIMHFHTTSVTDDQKLRGFKAKLSSNSNNKFTRFRVQSNPTLWTPLLGEHLT